MRTFLLHSPKGQPLGKVTARNAGDAVLRAQERLPEPPGGWEAVTVTMELDRAVLRKLLWAKGVVTQRLKQDPDYACPEGCAVLARQHEVAKDFDLAAEYWSAALALSIGASHHDHYTASLSRCLQQLDPDWRPGIL